LSKRGREVAPKKTMKKETDIPWKAKKGDQKKHRRGTGFRVKEGGRQKKGW